jgi:hypothetical protein
LIARPRTDHPPPLESAIAGPSAGSALTWLTAALVFLAAFLYRFLSLPTSPERLPLPNDHFVHLSRARQVLLGELPFRDFYDPGHFLRVYLSAALQALFGHHLLAETLLTVGLVSAGAALAFLLMVELSRSSLLSLLVVAMLIATIPDLHDYPKVLMFPLTAFLCWRYLERPRLATLLLLAACTVIAFLFRHDYLVYVGLAVLTTLLLVHRQDGVSLLLRRVVLFLTVIAALLLPFLLFLQLNGGVLRYVGFGVRYLEAHGMRSTGLSNLPRSLVGWVMPAVRVRWSTTVSPADRAELESRYGLVNGRQYDGATWEYNLTNPRGQNVHALVSDVRVDDTAGLDRGSARVESALSGFWRLVADPRIWLSLLLLALPLLALLLVLVRRRGRLSRQEQRDQQRVVILAILALSAAPLLLRQTDGSHIAGSAPLAAVLGAWLLALALRGGLGRLRQLALPAQPARRSVDRSVPRRLGAGALAVLQLVLGLLLLTVTWGNVVQAAPAEHTLRDSELLGGPAALATRGTQVISLLATRPPIAAIEAGSGPSERAFIHYLHACTRPTDRVLIATDAPIYFVFFYSERGFAGGLASYDPGQFSSLDDQRLTLARLQAQSVPVVLVDAQRSVFATEFPLVHDYVLANYESVREPPPPAERLVDTPRRHPPVDQHAIGSLASGVTRVRFQYHLVVGRQILLEDPEVLPQRVALGIHDGDRDVLSLESAQGKLLVLD